MPLVPKILVKRFKGTDEVKPMFKIYKDGALFSQEEIGGRQDVQPAFLRVQNRVKKEFGVELESAGRDAQKHLQWMSVNSQPPTSEQKN